MKNKVVFALLICLSFPVLLFSTPDYFLITDVGTSAKTIGIANIQGFNHTGGAIFENPASMFCDKKISTSVFSTTFMDEVKYNNFGVLYNTKWGNLSLGVMQSAVTGIPSTTFDELTNAVDVDGYVEHKNMIAKVGYQWQLLDDLYSGFTLNYFQNNIANIKATSINSDYGLFYRAENIEISACAQNVFGRNVVYSNDVIENMPGSLYLGLKTNYSDIDAYFQIKTHLRNRNAVRAVAIDYKPSFISKMLSLSVGYREFVVLSKIKNTVGFGVGVNLDQVGFHFAFDKSDHFEYDNRYYFSLVLNV